MDLITNFKVDIIYTENGTSLKLGCFIANILNLADLDRNQNKTQPLFDS